MCSTRNRGLLAHVGAALSAATLSGCLLLAIAGCQTHHEPDPMHTLVKETAPLPGTYAAVQTGARPTTSTAFPAETLTLSTPAPTVGPPATPTPSTPTPATPTPSTPTVAVAPEPTPTPPVAVVPTTPTSPAPRSTAALTAPPSSPAEASAARLTKGERKTIKHMGGYIGDHDPVQPNPPPDAAILARNWEPAASYYPSGAAVAFPTYTFDRDRLPPKLRTDTARGLLDPIIFIGDTLTLPIQMVFVAPWKEVVYHDVTYRATQTAVPPLPPE